MKKSVICVCTFLVAALCLFAGCNLFKAQPKEFEKAGMKITLTDDFYEKDMLSQTAYYESRTAIAVALKESFYDYPTLDEYSLREYASATIIQNDLIAAVNEREGKSYLYFSYEKAVSGKDFYYLATTHRSDDAFWLIQFACESKNKDEYTEQFLKWADSVTFTNAATDNVI